MVSSRNEGTAMNSRTITGRIVQATSSAALWVVRDGVGLTFS
jgi:hypothetical protein